MKKTGIQSIVLTLCAACISVGAAVIRCVQLFYYTDPQTGYVTGSGKELIARMKRQYPDGDMLPQALDMEKGLRASADGKTSPEARKVAQPVQSKIDDTPPAAPTPALSAEELLQRYRAAKDRMAALRKDKVRSCQRQPWEDLRDEFLSLQKARKHPVLGPASAFRAAVSQEELARCSHLSGEFRRAVELYLDVPDSYAKSALADDALSPCAANLRPRQPWPLCKRGCPRRRSTRLPPAVRPPGMSAPKCRLFPGIRRGKTAWK